MTFRERNYYKQLAIVMAQADMLDTMHNLGVIPDAIYDERVQGYITKIENLMHELKHPPRNTPKIPSMEQLLIQIKENKILLN